MILEVGIFVSLVRLHSGSRDILLNYGSIRYRATGGMLKKCGLVETARSP